MKKLLVISIVFLLACLIYASPAKNLNDYKNFWTDGTACYYVASNDKLPGIHEGYWGYCDVVFDSDSNSNIIKIILAPNNIRELFLIGKTIDRQKQQCLIIKKFNGTLRAYPLIKATENQYKKSISERKAYWYAGDSQIQDGLKPCHTCESKGKLIDGSICPNCKGTRQEINTVNVPKIKIVDQ